MIKPFVKKYNNYEIPNTRNIFKVVAKKESYKPMFLCCYQEIIFVKEFNNLVPQYSMKIKKMYNKEEALNFVLDKYNEYVEKNSSIK